MTHTNAETSKPHHIEPEPSAEVWLIEVQRTCYAQAEFFAF